MASGIKTGNPRGFNKGHSSKFRVGSRVRQTPDEGRRIYWPKRCSNNNKDKDNNPKTLNDKNHQASSQKSWQLIISLSKQNNFYMFKITHMPFNKLKSWSLIFLFKLLLYYGHNSTIAQSDGAVEYTDCFCAEG